MAIETKSKEIGGVTYTVTQLPGMKALRMQPRLARVIAPALAQASTDIGAGVASLFERLTPDELEAITRELLYNATADEIPLFGVKGCFESHFAGRSEKLIALLRFAIEEVNFAGFFAEFGGMLARLATAAKKAPAGSGSSSATTSAPGQAGG